MKPAAVPVTPAKNKATAYPSTPKAQVQHVEMNVPIAEGSPIMGPEVLENRRKSKRRSSLALKSKRLTLTHFTSILFPDPKAMLMQIFLLLSIISIYPKFLVPLE